MNFFTVDKKLFLYSLCLLLFFTQFFQYKYWDGTLAGRLAYIVYFSIILIFYKNKQNLYSNVFDSLIKWLIIVGTLHIVPYWLNGGSIYNERYLLLSMSVFLFYYIFGELGISEKTIVNVMTVFASAIFIIQVSQQFHPNSAVFGVFKDESIVSIGNEVAEVRNGLYRFRLSGILTVQFCLFYYWQKLLEFFSFKNLLIFCCFLCSLYLNLTRQLIFSSCFVLVFSFLFTGKEKSKLVVVAFFMCVVGYFLFDSLFGELLEKTTEEANESNIRNLCFIHYWTQVTSNIFTMVLGNGNMSIQSYWEEVFSFYRTDIGMLGEWYVYGLIWVLLYLYTMYLVFFKYFSFLPLYVKLFFLSTSMTSILIFPYRSSYEYFVWVSILYCSSLYINKENTLTLD